ncbi:MAG: CD225/dispanin family protein [Rikenellaceae bacterium]
MDKNLYFFVDVQGNQYGPVRAEYFRVHGIAASSLVWFEGMPHWAKASEVPFLKGFIRASGVESQAQPEHYHNHLISKTAQMSPPTDNAKQFLPLEVDPPKNWILESVMITIFCCFPFGIVALVYALKVLPSWNRGSYAESIKASQIAGQWVKWGVMIVLVVALIYILVSILVPSYHYSLFHYNQYLINQGLFE